MKIKNLKQPFGKSFKISQKNFSQRVEVPFSSKVPHVYHQTRPQKDTHMHRYTADQTHIKERWKQNPERRRRSNAPCLELQSFSGKPRKKKAQNFDVELSNRDLYRLKSGGEEAEMKGQDWFWDGSKRERERRIVENELNGLEWPGEREYRTEKSPLEKCV